MAKKSAVGDFLSKNAKDGMESFTKGTVGKLFGAAAIAEIATADNKLKALAKTIVSILAFKPMMAAFGLQVFGGMSKAVRSLVKDTGSLDAALKKISQIQGLKKTFEPLVGGAEAAKKKVAELTNFSAKFGKSLGQVAEAARSLMIMTNGGFGDAKDLKLIGDAAAGTQNDIVELADAVGQLYANLSNGESISGSLDGLRQMGAISSSTAKDLQDLRESGASNSQVFDALKAKLSEFNGGMENAKDTIEGVKKAYETAVQALQEEFGSPFVESDIENTKNMTSALEALAPTVGRVATFFEALTGGFSTFKTGLVSAIANVPPLRIAVEGLVYVLGLLIAGIGVFSAVAFTTFLVSAIPAALGLGTAITSVTASTVAATAGVTGLGTAVSILVGIARVAAPVIATLAISIGIITAVTAAIGILVGVGYMAVKMWNAEKDALEALNRAYKERAGLLDKQIASMRTLQDQSEALAKALKSEAEAQDELNEAIRSGSQARIEAAQANLADAKSKTNKVINTPAGQLAPNGEQVSQARAHINRIKMLQDQDYQNKLNNAGPEEKITLMEERLGKVKEKGVTGNASMEARLKAAAAKDQTENEKVAARGRLDTAKTSVEALQAKRDEEQARIDDGRDRTSTQRAKVATLQAQLDAAKAEAEKAATDLKNATDAQNGIGKGAAGSAGIDQQLRMLGLGKTEGILKPEDKGSAEAAKARLTLEKEKALQLEEDYSSGSLATESVGLQKALELAKQEKALNDQLADIEERRLTMKETGYEAVKKEVALQKEALNAQIAFEKNKEGTPDQNKIKDLESQLAALKKASGDEARSFTRGQQGIGDDAAKQKARIAGNSTAAQTIDDYAVFEQRRQQLEASGLGRDEAKEQATDYAEDAVTIDSRNSAASFESQVSATNLARIGGGGNIGFGNPQLDEAKRQSKLLEKIEKNTGEEKENVNLAIK